MANTKKSLWGAGLALLVSIALLVGTTFAWFTDSVINKGNVITAGDLKISATAYDADMSNTSGQSYEIKGINNGNKIYFETTGQNLKDDANPIINESLWEPGKSNAKLLEVKNEGSLAAKISLDFDIKDGGLQNALWFDFIQVGADGALVGEFTKRPMSQLASLGDSREFSLAANQSISFILVYGMNEDAGNEYQGKTFGADVTILAKQDTVEKDGFGGDQYDKNAMYDNGDGTFTQDGKTFVEVGGEYIEVTADENVAGLYKDSEGGNYVSIGAAVNEVFANAGEGENITFINDVTFAAKGSAPFLTVENAIVDLNGKIVTVNKGDNSNAFGVTGDGSVVKNGTFKCGIGRDDYPLWITGNTGKNHVTVENVTVEGGMQMTGTVEATLKNVTITANTYYDVYMAQNSKVTVESGNFTSVGSMPHFYIQNYSASYNPTVIINGGSFSGGTPTVGVMSNSNPYTFTNNL